VKKRTHINEQRFQHIIEIAIPASGLDAQTSRSIMDFHGSRKIQIRFGHGLKSLSRWCFSDAATAEAFKKQFGGNHVVKNRKTLVKRTMPTIIAAVFVSNPIGYLVSSVLLSGGMARRWLTAPRRITANIAKQPKLVRDVTCPHQGLLHKYCWLRWRSAI